MRVILIDLPPVVPEVNILSAGLGYLASSLKAASHQVKVLDFFNNPKDIEKRLMQALSEKPDIIGLSVVTPTMNIAVKIATMVRKESCSSLIVAGGAHVCVDGLNFIKDNKVFDVGVIGEGEYTIVELCDFLEGKKKIEDIKGIIFRRKDEVLQTSARGFLEDLDSLPNPDYTVFDSGYRNFPYSLVFNRGCPFGCYFCCVHAIMGKQVRHRNINNVIAELKTIKDQYVHSGFIALGDNLTYDIQKAKEFCDGLVVSKIELGWEAVNVRADTIDSELLIKMKKVGCREIILGVESADPKVLCLADKGETLKDIERAISLAKKAGLSVSAHFIIGLPGSTYESEIQSVKFAKRLKIDYCMFRHCLPFHGTRLFDWCEKNHYFLVNYKNVDSWARVPFFETDTFSKNERNKAYEMCNVCLRQYHNVIDSSVQGYKRASRIILLLLKYDIFSLPGEMFRLVIDFLFKKIKYFSKKRR